MRIETMRILMADEGKILTDGNAYFKHAILGKGRSEDEFHEITETEYEEINNE